MNLSLPPFSRVELEMSLHTKSLHLDEGRGSVKMPRVWAKDDSQVGEGGNKLVILGDNPPVPGCQVVTTRIMKHL